MDSKVILITGASSGFGKVTSELLAERGYHVFGTSQKPANLKVKPQGVEMLELDVDSDLLLSNFVKIVAHLLHGKYSSAIL